MTRRLDDPLDRIVDLERRLRALESVTGSRYLTEGRHDALDHADVALAEQAHSVSWAAATTNPSIGNGALTGRYVQIGKLVVYHVHLQFGSTTSGGSGNWSFSLPVTALTNTNHTGTVWLRDSSTGLDLIGLVRRANSTTAIVYGGVTGSANNGEVEIISEAKPWTWATNDAMQFTLAYTAA